MATFSTLLEEALDAWAYTRAGVIAEVRNMPEQAMHFRPSEESRSVLELGFHIVQSGAMMAGELSRAGGDFHRQSYPDFMEEHAGDLKQPGTQQELVHLLERSHGDGARKLEEAGELALLQTIRRFDGVRGTRLAWMNHGIGHEEYHRGQLALYARLQGVEPALTKQIRGM